MAEVKANVDWQTVLTQVLKYLIEGLVVALAAWYIPGRVMKLDEIATISLIAAATFGLLDMWMGPQSLVSQNVRSGAGLGIGANLVGFPMKF
jgi:hypothetical protein